MYILYWHLLLILFLFGVIFRLIKRYYNTLEIKRQDDFLAKRKMVFDHFKVTEPHKLTKDKLNEVICSVIGASYNKFSDVQKILIKSSALKGYASNPKRQYGKRLKYQ